MLAVAVAVLEVQQALRHLAEVLEEEATKMEIQVHPLLAVAVAERVVILQHLTKMVVAVVQES
jgi:tRNA G26 N,N-dimethylase Trm1